MAPGGRVRTGLGSRILVGARARHPVLSQLRDECTDLHSGLVTGAWGVGGQGTRPRRYGPPFPSSKPWGPLAPGSLRQVVPDLGPLPQGPRHERVIWKHKWEEQDPKDGPPEPRGNTPHPSFPSPVCPRQRPRRRGSPSDTPHRLPWRPGRASARPPRTPGPHQTRGLPGSDMVPGRGPGPPAPQWHSEQPEPRRGHGENVDSPRA